MSGRVYLSDILFKIFTDFIGELKGDECDQLLKVIERHVETGEIHPIIFHCLKFLCYLDEDILKMDSALLHDKMGMYGMDTTYDKLNMMKMREMDMLMKDKTDDKLCRIYGVGCEKLMTKDMLRTDMDMKMDMGLGMRNKMYTKMYMPLTHMDTMYRRQMYDPMYRKMMMGDELRGYYGPYAREMYMDKMGMMNKMDMMEMMRMKHYMPRHMWNMGYDTMGYLRGTTGTDKWLMNVMPGMQGYYTTPFYRYNTMMY